METRQHRSRAYSSYTKRLAFLIVIPAVGLYCYSLSTRAAKSLDHIPDLHSPGTARPPSIPATMSDWTSQNKEYFK